MIKNFKDKSTHTQFPFLHNLTKIFLLFTKLKSIVWIHSNAISLAAWSSHTSSSDIRHRRRQQHRSQTNSNDSQLFPSQSSCRKKIFISAIFHPSISHFNIFAHSSLMLTCSMRSNSFLHHHQTPMFSYFYTQTNWPTVARCAIWSTRESFTLSAKSKCIKI